MSALTPPKYWKTQGQADYWLGRFIEETDGPLRYTDLFGLSFQVFDKIRNGWETRIVLKKRFADDPDALAKFIEYERMPWQLREMKEEMEADMKRLREEMKEYEA